MLDPLSLKRPVGDGRDNDPDDLFDLSISLAEIGRYGDDAYWPAERWDQPIQDAVKAFQAEAGQAADGWLRPGGPTEEAINAALDRRRALARDGFGIGDGVGAGQANRPGDVAHTRLALRDLGYSPLATEDSSAAARARTTAGALGAFQRDLGLETDGWMAPGGPTEGALQESLKLLDTLRSDAATARNATEATSAAGTNSRFADRATDRAPAEPPAFDADAALRAAGYTYRPDPMGRLGQGEWIDEERKPIGPAQRRAALQRALTE